MQKEFNQFRKHLELRYPGRSTTKHYMSDLAIFQQFIGDIPPKQITVKTIDQFVQAQSEQGMRPATINRRLSAIASFFEYLIAESEDDNWQNPVHRQRHSVSMGHHLPRDASDTTVATLLVAIEDKRDRAIVCLMLGAGLRIGEVVSLELKDLDDSDTTHMVRLGTERFAARHQRARTRLAI